MVATRAANTSKRKPKTEVKFLTELNSEQKVASETILKNDVVLLTGQAGSGKTLLACSVALQQFVNREIDRIIISRPAVSAADDIGFLPGTMQDKMDPWLAPIYGNLYQLLPKATIDNMIKQGDIEIVPLSYVRGRTFLKSFVIIDEAQNVNTNQTQMLIGRLGIDSRMVFCGDVSQVDLRRGATGLTIFNSLAKHISGVEVVTLLKNHRHPIVPLILDYISENSENV